jgi:ABC-2 type transport system permease protein
MGAIWIIVLREMRIYFRDRSYVISSIFRPILWLLFIGFGVGAAVKVSKGPSYSQFVLPGIIGMSILFTSVFFGMSVIWDRQFGFLKVILVSPVRRSYVVIAKTLSGAFIASFQGIVVLLLAPLMKLHPSAAQVAGTVALMFVCSMALTSMGLFIASRMESFEGFNLIMNFILMPMFFFSGALFPVHKVPAFLRWVVMVNPMTYCVDALRYALIGVHEFNLMLDGGIILGFMLLAWQLATFNFERG